MFFVDLDSRSKVKFQGQTGNQLNMGSYLKTYLTHRLHTWYQDIQVKVKVKVKCKKKISKNLKKMVDISDAISPTHFILDTKVQPNKVHSTI